MSPPEKPTNSLSLRHGLLYAAGDLGPSLTSLCLAFYWLYFLISVAKIPALHAGIIHGSGYVVSAFASLWAGNFLDRRVSSASGRCRLIVVLGLGLATNFVLLWSNPDLGAWKTLWYLLLSWLFHVLFALVYLAYLSLTSLLASEAKERVDLNSYRFGGTMLVTLALLGLHSMTENLWGTAERLLLLGGMVGIIAGVGSSACGLGLRRSLATSLLERSGQQVGWLALASSKVLWSAVGSNLAVWFMVQTASVLTIFLCKSAGTGDAEILLLMQFCIIVAAAVTSVASRRIAQTNILATSASLWCVGAALWWSALSPWFAAMLLGLGLGTATVISWAKIPNALDQFAASVSNRADARVYAGLTVLRDLVSASVPLLATVTLSSHPIGSVGAGQIAATLLILSGLCSALVLMGLQFITREVVRPADVYTSEARK